MTVHVNYLAVLVCAIASMVVGFVWYGPLFGKSWMRSLGLDPMDTMRMKEMQSKAMPGYVAMFIGSLVMAYVLAKVLGHFGVGAIDMNLLKVVGGVWLGFVATDFLGVKFFENKSWSYYFINVGY